MSNTSVTLSDGTDETVLPLAPEAERAAIDAARINPDPRAALHDVIRTNPQSLEGWAQLSRLAEDDVEAYAYARVGYHRGLDALRKSGWRGTGWVRWRHEGNRGFLRALDALRSSAERIGETDEAERCLVFLKQCDPTISIPVPG